jgi:Holliday junction resolvasome RuvABC ATP-dependent DNA helicase subunit
MIEILSLLIAIGIVSAFFAHKGSKQDNNSIYAHDFQTNGVPFDIPKDAIIKRVWKSEAPTAITIKEDNIDITRLVEYTGEAPKKFEFRPQTFDQFIGQAEAKERAKTIIKKIKLGLRSHFLVDGIKGHGKTTYVKLIQAELGGKLIQHIGSQVTPDNIIDILNDINASQEKYVIWFVDEFDTMPPKTIKILNPVLEEFMLAGKHLKPFVFAGATINKHSLIKHNPDTLDRIPFSVKFQKYNTEELIQILIQYHSQLYSHIFVHLTDLTMIAQNCKFNPRTSIGLLEEYVVERNVEKVLKNNNIIKDGLTKTDIKILEILSKVKRMGANAIASKIGMGEKEYLVEFEPFLCEYGYINRVPNRIIAEKGLEVLKQIKGE